MGLAQHNLNTQFSSLIMEQKSWPYQKIPNEIIMDGHFI